MNLLPFLSDLTRQIVGKQVCPYCGCEDLFFAYDNQCMECHKPIPAHTRAHTLEYSLGVLIEFISKYDDQLPEEPKFIILNELRRDLKTIKLEGYLSDIRLDKHKKFFQMAQIIGTKKYHARIKINNNQSNLDFDFEFPNPMERIKSITAVVGALANINIINK
jgi:hypothetical protein